METEKIIDILSTIDKNILINCTISLTKWGERKMAKKEKSVFVFYSKSADKKAGMGTGETLQPGDDFSELNKIKDWRKVLSNFHYDPFIWDDSEWACIEEAFQATKFGRENRELFKAALMKNCTDVRDIGTLAQKMRKWKTFDKTQLAEWDKKKDSIMKSISKAKYAQSQIGKRVLKLTGDATLLHHLQRKAYKLHFKHLEEIRNNL